MKIKKIRLQRFRQFSDTTIEFGDFNVLVGPNNSGKTTVLHAIRAFFLLMHGAAMSVSKVIRQSPVIIEDSYRTSKRLRLPQI
jgi:predicted ATP-dependent endonuclease of OLD family